MTDQHDVTGLVTLQFHVGGLFDGEPVEDLAHLVRAAEHGTPGPTLCGIDRFAEDSPGWSVGGGIRRFGHWPMPCIPCDEVRERDYPELRITGMFASSFLRVVGEPTLAEIQEWYRRSNIAEFHNEPLYVTPEEYAYIKERFSAPPGPPDSGFGPRSVDPSFIGTRVIVDAEKAAEQRARG